MAVTAGNAKLTTVESLISRRNNADTRQLLPRLCTSFPCGKWVGKKEKIIYRLSNKFLLPIPSLANNFPVDLDQYELARNGAQYPLFVIV